EADHPLVGIEDLWATALKEGKNRFNQRNMWGATGPAQTGDMLGQTTIGPWQITIENARELGATYGVSSNFSSADLISFLENRPKLQARIAADFLQESYTQYGKRSPWAMQRYFWLEAFREKKIGQGHWYDSVLAKNPKDMRN